jgi:hypothetical protein
MTDDYDHSMSSNQTSTSKTNKEHVHVYTRRRYRRRRQSTTTSRYRAANVHSFPSEHTQQTLPSHSNKIQELVRLIQQQLNTNENRSRHHKQHVIIVNYKPVYVNTHSAKASSTIKMPVTPVSKTSRTRTDDEFSSATHYSRRHSLTTTSSDGSPLRSSNNRSPNQQSMSLDVPDVEDPLMFIEMMYQQLFTEDGHLRSGTEPNVLANCVKQIVTNSRRNSISSSKTNNSSMSYHLKPTIYNAHQSQRYMASPKMSSTSPSPRLILNDQYDTFSEEANEEHDNDEDEVEGEDEDEDEYEEEAEDESNTLVQNSSQRRTTSNKSTIDLSRK